MTLPKESKIRAQHPSARVPAQHPEPPGKNPNPLTIWPQPDCLSCTTPACRPLSHLLRPPSPGSPSALPAWPTPAHPHASLLLNHLTSAFGVAFTLFRRPWACLAEDAGLPHHAQFCAHTTWHAVVPNERRMDTGRMSMKRENMFSVA